MENQDLDTTDHGNLVLEITVSGVTGTLPCSKDIFQVNWTYFLDGIVVHPPMTEKVQSPGSGRNTYIGRAEC